MLLHCIRHGESLHNAEGRVQGQSDVALSELGHRQSRAAAEALARLPIDAIYASPLRRARQTAEAVAQCLEMPIQEDPRLMEIHAGIFQNKLRDELERLHPEELARWRSEDLDFTIPGGESRRELIIRGRAALNDIAGSGHGQVVVVAHGRLLIVTIKALLGMAPEDPPFALQNGSITTLASNGDDRYELVAMDQIEHLREVGLAGSGDL